MSTTPPSSRTLPQIDNLMDEIQKRRPLNPGELRELMKSLRVMEVYHSNAIEGNTLTLGETRLIIEDGITIGGKTVRELHEATNLAQALDKVLQGVEILSESTIQMLHGLIMRSIDDDNAGVYRQTQVYISGDESRPPQANRIPVLMRELLSWYDESIKKSLHPVLIASEFHYRFVKVHPFVDGNGRTARLLANLILISSGYPMIIIPVIRRMEYISSLHSITGSLERFQDLYADIVHENLKDYMRMIEE